MPLLERLASHTDIGLLLARLGLGSMMIFHGAPKLMGGPDLWTKIGGAIGNLGINFYPVFWGAMASLAEGFGGVLILLGLWFRPAALLICFTMIVAVISHFERNDGLAGASHAIETGLAFLIFMFVGPGRFSVDKK